MKTISNRVFWELTRSKGNSSEYLGFLSQLDIYITQGTAFQCLTGCYSHVSRLKAIVSSDNNKSNNNTKVNDAGGYFGSGDGFNNDDDCCDDDMFVVVDDDIDDMRMVHC